MDAAVRGRPITIAFSNPHARVTRDTPATLVVELPDVPGSSAQWSGVRVKMSFEGEVTSIEVSRSVSTSNEAYLVLEGEDRSVVVTDHFLTALRHCTAAQREPSDDALIDYLLFRNLSCEMTYASGVVRIGHGRTVQWRSTDQKLRTIRQETLECPSTTTFADALSRLEDSLVEVIGGVVHSGGTPRNLLSGGVDSTLIQMLLPRGSSSLSFGIDTPEFAPEVSRALTASRLTASQHTLIQLHEREYLEALERFLKHVGLPPHHLQSILLAELFRRMEGEKAYLLTGQLADALFGLRFSLRVTTLGRWGWIPKLLGLAHLPQRLTSAKLRHAEAMLASLRERVSSPRGLAARIACYTDFGFVEDIFGASEIERRLRKRLDYVFELCPFLSPDARGAIAHLETGHMVDYFCDDAVSIWRQSAMSYGGYLIGPFTCPPIVESSLRFSPRGRYCRGGELKPALKAILRKRLPEYDTRLPKLSTGLPIHRFLESGPLRDTPYLIWPDFLPRSVKCDGIPYPPWIAWSILTLTAWRALACEGSASPPRSFSRTLSLRCA
jgi:asparagine synthase (glutamine-hydrolysing)